MEDWYRKNNEPPLYIEVPRSPKLLSEGCEIYGIIENSVLFSGVKVEKGASLKTLLSYPIRLLKRTSGLKMQ